MFGSVGLVGRLEFGDWIYFLEPAHVLDLSLF